jgi:hypothetical protein
MELEFCYYDSEAGEMVCNKVEVVPPNVKPDIKPDDGEPGPDEVSVAVNDIMNLMVAKTVVAQLENTEIRDRLSRVVSDGLAEVTKDLGSGAFLKHSFG